MKSTWQDSEKTGDSLDKWINSLMIMELNQVILCLVLFCGIKLTWCSNSRTSSQNTGVIPIARCRVRCLTKVSMHNLFKASLALRSH